MNARANIMHPPKKAVSAMPTNFAYSSKQALKLGLKGSLIVAGLTLIACGSNPNKTTSYSRSQDTLVEQTNDVAELLAKSRKSSGRESNQYILTAAQQLSREGDSSWALSLLKSIDPTRLSDPQFIDFSLLLGQLSLEEGSYFLSRDILGAHRLSDLKPHLSPEQNKILAESRATVYTLLGNTRAGVEERLALENWLTDEEKPQNKRALWQTLMMESGERLQVLGEQAEQALDRGWYQLAAIAKNQHSSIEEQRQQVEAWRRSNLAHPAALQLPADLQLLGQLIAEQPRKIALMLPVSGKLAKAGQAIRDGFMASFYDARQRNGDNSLVEFFDTNNQDINQVYQAAVASGAELVIGPLDKSKLKKLNQQSQLSVPVLAMNYIDAPSENSQAEYHPQLFQFGLAVQDEARQCAQRARLEGHKRALILAPQTAWGNRGVQAFRDQWEQLGGVIVEEQRFTGNNDYSRVIENSLQLNQSKYRHRKLQQILAGDLDFEPRRRQDVDMIFLLARANQAKQVKPTLAFHYAGKIPVYATSHIYNGQADPKANRDLNNIRFTALPWLLNHDQAARKSVDDYAKPNPAYQQLYALGADSFKIYPRLKQLAQVPSLRIQGNTGSLSMLENGQLAREQDWAIIRNGKAITLPSLVGGKGAASSGQ